MLDKINFQLNEKISLYYKKEKIEATFKGKVGQMYLSNVTNSLDSCFLIEIRKEVLRIAETDLLKAYNDRIDIEIEELPF